MNIDKGLLIEAMADAGISKDKIRAVMVILVDAEMERQRLAIENEIERTI